MENIKRINENEIMVDDCVYRKVEEPKPEFKVGDWVIGNAGYKPYLTSRVIVLPGYGNMTYDDQINGAQEIAWKGYIRHATNDEIESHLKKICDEKYPKGTKYEDAIYGNRAEVQGILIYFPEGDCMTDGWGGSVYGNGKFAEIIPDKKKLPKTNEAFENFLHDWEKRGQYIDITEFLKDYE